jgi:hypothetical protein
MIWWRSLAVLVAETVRAAFDSVGSTEPTPDPKPRPAPKKWIN